MFGLIMGMSVFSVLSMQWAKQEMARQNALRAAQEKAQAEDLAHAMEFSLLTETNGTYREDLDLKRAMQYTSLATGKTRGGERVLVNVQDVDAKGSFGAGNQRVGVTTSDDILKRSQVYRAASAAELNRLAAQSGTVVTFDTSAIRTRQMKNSISGLEGMAEQVYAFYAGHMRFPSGSEYTELAGKFDFHDAWGQKFDYIFTDGENAALQFTTPWNYTYTQKLNLRDNSQATVTDNAISGTEEKK
ncbi:MAG TPA: hypothetical protein VHP58_04790 [Alphaproteobacteria bacterium]|nr:hypothetical protein [Alphaproteobacteria bacterium]